MTLADFAVKPQPFARVGPPDQATVALAQAGDEAAFERIFTHYEASIYNFLYRLTYKKPDQRGGAAGGADQAADLTQDVFIKAWLGLAKVSDPNLKIGPWLYRIATNVFLDHARHEKLVRFYDIRNVFPSFFGVTRDGPDPDAGLAHRDKLMARDRGEVPERALVASEDAAAVETVLSKMRGKYRLVLILREYNDFSYDAIAEVLNTTRAAVKSLIFRAREEFRQVSVSLARKGAIAFSVHYPALDEAERVAERAAAA